MNNLFSTFDPCTGMLSLNWMSSIIFLIMIPNKFWKMNNTYTMLMKKMSEMMNKEINMNTEYKTINMMMFSLMMFILINNMMGLLPYTFTSSAQIVFSMALSFPMWVSFMMFGWTKKTKTMLANLLPKNTPTALMPFMILIEFTSNLIRPSSLAIRLSANMIAGHILFSLMGNNSMYMMMIIMLIMMMFELAVSLIQSYVFMTLMTLYSSEV
uniref:ATP synthase subunit a n=1 Tax=Iassus dorsalis TaxID=1962553 RepID=A0A6C0MCP4_9HEMI|nr:ATP synthase F0 subunit 6 [Iassus dorsalis]QHV34337.1 ATP synthase F0 subunit 6 [Iassus dorsalis]